MVTSGFGSAQPPAGSRKTSATERSRSAEIPKGYKQTEVGVIPDDWEVKRLGECLSQNPDYGINAAAVTNNGDLPRYLRITDITEDGRFSNDKLVSVNHVDSAEFYLTEGDLVFARTGASVGKTYLYNPNDGKLVFAGFLIRIKCNLNCLLPTYLKFHTQTTPYWSWISANSIRTGQPGINGNEYKELPIPLPPTMEEQEAIASALTDVDSLIESLELLIEKKRNIKQGTMQELLTGKTRLPGFENKKGYKQTEVGVIPEDWEVKRLGEIGESLIGLTYSPNNVKSHGVLVLRSSNVQKNKLAYDNNVFVEMDLPNRVIVRENDILICVRNGSRQLIGKCALIDKKASGFAFGAFMSLYRSDLNQYVFFQFQAFGIQRQINETLGATINQITNKDLSKFQIPLPPTMEEQEAIASALTTMDLEIEELETRLGKTRDVKSGMMQDLLTGRVRLV